MDLKPPGLEYMEGENRCPYEWSTGETVGAFLSELRDHKRLIGAVCAECGAVWSPPTSYCESCGGGIEDLTEVGPKGVVMSWSRVAGGFEGAPVQAPFRYVLVRLAGTDSAILHLAPDDDRIEIGAVLRPEWRDERHGSITDIKWFVPDEEQVVIDD